MTKFGEYIRNARERRGWTLRAAAKHAGIAHSRLFELESGISSKTGKPVVPTRPNLERLAKGYGLPMDELVGLAHYPETLKERSGLGGKEMAALDILRSLSPSRQDLWLEIGVGLKRLPPEEIPPTGSPL